MPCRHCGETKTHMNSRGQLTYLCGWSGEFNGFYHTDLTACQRQGPESKGHVPISSDQCVCKIMDLMAFGCKCGAFQREKAKKT